MIDLITSPVPSLSYLNKALFKYIANHPLIINPPVFHPITKERVEIERYKLFNGIELESGLACSIFPHYQDPPTAPDPSSHNVSALFSPHNLGPDGNDQAVYHFVIKFHYSNLILGNQVEGDDITLVNREAATHPNQILLTSFSKKNVELQINPGADIIGNYLEILRLVIEDPIHKAVYQPFIEVDSIELLLINLRSVPWEKKKEIYFHEGEALIRIDSYVSRGWRDKFLHKIKDINLHVMPDEAPKPYTQVPERHAKC
jgi:hypothetical protein